jgi:sirohydrochlorin ferrochelatase
MATREDVLNALVTKLQGMTFAAPINGKTTWVGTVGRRIKLWGNVPPDRRPAAFLVERGERDERRHLGTPPLRTLTPRLVAYTSVKDQTQIGGTHLNLILESLEAALTPDNWGRGTLTLAGESYFVRIEGEIFKDAGDLDGDAMLVVPIAIQMP